MVGEGAVVGIAVMNEAEEDRLDRNDHMTHMSVPSVDNVDMGAKAVLKFNNSTTKHLFLNPPEGRRGQGSGCQSQMSRHTHT